MLFRSPPDVAGLKLRVNLPKHGREDKKHLWKRESDRATSGGRDKGKVVQVQPHSQPNKGQQKTLDMEDVGTSTKQVVGSEADQDRRDCTGKAPFATVVANGGKHASWRGQPRTFSTLRRSLRTISLAQQSPCRCPWRVKHS